MFLHLSLWYRWAACHSLGYLYLLLCSNPTSHALRGDTALVGQRFSFQNRILFFLNKQVLSFLVLYHRKKTVKETGNKCIERREVEGKQGWIAYCRNEDPSLRRMQKNILQWSWWEEKKSKERLTVSSGGKQPMYTGCRGKESSNELLLLQVDVFSGAGILQVFLVVLLKGPTAEKTNK